MRAVASFPTLSQAQALRIALEADGIPAAIGDEQAVSLVAGAVAVSVLDDRDYDRARVVAARLEGSIAVARDDDVRRCPKCDAENPSNFNTCWRCQAGLSDVALAPPRADRNDSTPLATPAILQSTDGTTRRPIAVELGIILVLTYWSVPITVWERITSPDTTTSVSEPEVVQVARMIFYLGFSALVLYLLWQRAGSLRPVGLANLRWTRELGFALLILLATGAVVFSAAAVADAIGIPRWTSDPAPRPAPGAVFPALLFTAALHEEALFRAYLITRFETLMGRTVPAVGLSAVLFALGHLASPARSFELLCAGILWGALFASTRRLPRLVLAHWAWNLLFIYSRH